MIFRTYPRIPFYEQVHDNEPFYTDTGRLHAYADIPEAIEYGENFIVHREGPEATPYLPNVIVSTNPLVRPEDYGIPRDAEHWDERTIRNVKMPWSEVKKTKNFLWEKGYQFYCLTPKTRHRVHSRLVQRRLAHALRLELRRPLPRSTSARPASASTSCTSTPRRPATSASTTATTSTSTPTRPTGRTSAPSPTTRSTGWPAACCGSSTTPPTRTTS